MASVGSIEYTVSVETQQSIDAAQKFTRDMDKVDSSSRKADASLGKFNGRTKKTADAVRRANGELSNQSKALSGLIKMVGAYLSIRAVRSAIDLADRYEEMAGRIRDATESTEEYNKVQDRLLAVANRSYRALGEIQEAYIQSSRGLRDMGYSTEEALDVTESLSLAFVRNSTSSDKAASAMNALVRATNRGTVLTDHWASLLIAVPTIVDDIAAATGKTTQEISRLGYAGQLSAGMLTEGLRVAREENGRVADEMATTVSDAVTRLTNSFQVLTAQVNESSGASGGLSSAIDELASILQDPKTVEAAVQLATGIAAAFGGIVKGAREVVSITRWMAEEVAATFNGIASDDVVRLEQEADKIRKALEGGIMGMGDRLRFFGPDGVVKFWSRAELEAELARIEKATEESYKRMGRNMPDPIPAPSAEKPQVRSDLINTETEATKKLTGAKRGLTDAEKELLKAEQDRARGIERDASVLESLHEALYQTTLEADALRDRQAELMLSKYATPEQVADVQRLTKAISEAEQKATDLERRRSAFGTDVAGAITGSVSPLSGGMFDDQTERYEAEAQAEQQRYADAMARLQEAKELELEVKGGYMALEEQMAQEHADRLAQIEKAKNDMMMTQAADAFGSMASNLQDYITTFGSENKALMAMMKASAIAQTIIQTYQGAQQAFTAMSSIPYVGPALGAAAAAAAVAGGMARVASIRAQGTRRQGGPVSPGSMYRVNEGGRPEVFQNNMGQQYMIPNERGKVVSNRDAQGGGGIVVNIHNAPPGTQAESSEGPDGEQMIDIWVADFMADGRTASAVQGKFGLSPQGR